MNIFIDCGTHRFEGFSQFRDKHNIYGSWKSYCFEADPHTYASSKEIYENLKSSGLNIDHRNLAISSVNGEVRFNSSETESQGSNILEAPPQWDFAWDHGFNYRKEEIVVECFDFSEFLNDVVSDSDFVVVKMNIEGAEFDVIESIINTGAYKLLNEFHCWYHERFFDDVVGYHARRRRYDNFFNSLENFSYSSYS
jgi:FkbM family methyltransferase